jgi:hypothetical protein
MPRPVIVPAPSLDSLKIRPWPDPVIDSLGYDPRSAYVETYWLGILGPSTTWLLRRLTVGLERTPSGFDLHLHETAQALGLGGRGGRHSPFMRALTRLVQFDLAQPRSAELAVRRKVPPLNRRQLHRLPASLQAEHMALVAADLSRPPFEQVRRRARQLALSLLELGEDLEAAERQLLRWRFHPALAREASAWAWDRHRRALAAAQELPASSVAVAVASGAVAGEAAGLALAGEASADDAA